MPYHRRRFGGRRFRRRGSYRRGRYSRNTRVFRRSAGCYQKCATMMNAFFKQEVKCYDSVLGSFVPLNVGWDNVNFNPAVNLSLNGMGVGSSRADRTGMKIVMKDIILGVNVFLNTLVSGTAGPTPSAVCFGLVYVKDPHGESPVTKLNQLYENTLGGSYTVPTPQRILAYSRDFKVIRRWIITFRHTGMLAAAPTVLQAAGAMRSFEVRIPLRNMITTFSAATAGYGSIVEGGLYMFANCSTNNAYYIGYHARLRFYDA